MTEKKYMDKGWLNQGDMAKSLGLSVSGFMRWGVEPVARIGRYTYYSAEDVYQNRLDHKAAMLKKKAGSASGQNFAIRLEKLRLMQLQAEAQELKNKQLREELIEVDLLRWTLTQAGKQIAAIFGEIPERLRKKGPKLNAAGNAVIRREVGKCQKIALELGLCLDLDEYLRNTD